MTGLIRLRRRGFTLIELLVVVAIIAVLIAILLPSLGRARERAKLTVCATHIRGWGQGFLMYCTDFNGQLPLDGGDGVVGAASPIPIGVWSDPRLWFNGVTQYVNGHAGYNELQDQAAATGNPYNLPKSGTNSLYICPSAGEVVKDPAITSGDLVINGFFSVLGYYAITKTQAPTQTKPMLLSYGMNSQLRSWNYGSPIGYYSEQHSSDDIWSVTQLKSPAMIPLVAEKRVRYDEVPKTDRFFNTDLSQSKVTATRFASRHLLKGGNIVFADGHVDFLTYKSVTPPTLLKKNHYNVPNVVTWSPAPPLPK